MFALPFLLSSLAISPAAPSDPPTGGEAIPFTESYLLCGQCHGEKLRDWKVGVHGKRTGDWNGRKQYLLCAHCHDPHSPRFKPLKPLPPPVPPEQIRPARGGAR